MSYLTVFEIVLEYEIENYENYSTAKVSIETDKSRLSENSDPGEPRQGRTQTRENPDMYIVTVGTNDRYQR